MPQDQHRIDRHPWADPSLGIATRTRRPQRSVAFAPALLLASALGDSATVEAAAQHADWVVVKKSERTMWLLHEGEVIREYRIALGGNPRGHKLSAGDQRTPVGDYALDWRNSRSDYYKSIHVSYPNERDRKLAQQLGARPGGMIMIHGSPNDQQSATGDANDSGQDWTNGCIAVDNEEMDEIWGMVADGTPIRIRE